MPGGTLFGNFTYTWNSGWYITHEDLGSEFVMDANDGVGGVYMYDFGSSSWFYTGPLDFAFLYDFNSYINAWLWYLPDPLRPGHYTSNPREFHDMTTGQTYQLGSGGAGTTIPPDTPAANSVSITGGSNNGASSGTAAPNTPLTFTFAYHDTPDGALGIQYVEVALTGGEYPACDLEWGPQFTLALTDYILGVYGAQATGNPPTVSDGYCTVSSPSITYSSTDSTLAWVTFNLTFTGLPPASYQVSTRITDSDGTSNWGTVGSWTESAALTTLSITTAASPSFEVDTAWYTERASFARQPGGDTLTVTQTPLPPNDAPAPTYSFSSTDGSAPAQAIVAPPSGEPGAGNCPWRCNGDGYCHAPVPTGPPSPAPVINPNGVTGALIAGGTAMINIQGSNFGTTAGELFFCQQGASPCVLPNGGTPMSYTFGCTGCSWSDGSIEVQVTLPDSAPTGPWWVYVISLAWLPGSAFTNPSLGSVEVDSGPTLTGPIGVPLNGSATFNVTVPQNLGEVQVVVTLSTYPGTGSATFADGTTETTLYVEESQDITVKGTLASSTANNLTISASVEGYDQPVSQQFSVVSVVISLTSGATPAENTQSSQWKDFTDLVGGTNPGLGAGLFYDNGPGPQSCIVGVELVGTVTPSNYTGLVTLNRTIISTAAFLGQESYDDPGLRPPGPDNSSPSLVNNTVGSGAAGQVFDLDTPGVGPGQSLSAPERYRTNFQEYAVLGSQNSTVTVGTPFPYYVAVSCGGVDLAPALDTTYVANGDNSANGGTVPLTFDLKQH